MAYREHATSTLRRPELASPELDRFAALPLIHRSKIADRARIREHRHLPKLHGYTHPVPAPGGIDFTRAPAMTPVGIALALPFLLLG